MCFFKMADITVNTGKTKVTVFKRAGRRAGNRWYYRDCEIMQVSIFLLGNPSFSSSSAYMALIGNV
jgi:hypothetical protein